MNSNNYNCLIKLAGKSPLTRSLIEGAALGGGIGLGMPMLQVGANAAKATNAMAGALTGAAGTAMQALTPKPKTHPAVNPATGGTRLLVKGDQPIGPALYSNQIKGDLPITPYSSGKVNIDTMRAAKQLTANMNAARAANESGKARNAQNLDAMFKLLHALNLQRRAAGLPDYVPTAKDVYAPNASSTAEYGEAENRILNDAHSSAIAQEAARRGTPMNDAELYGLPLLMPLSMEARLRRQLFPAYDRLYMGLQTPLGMSPNVLGRTANTSRYPLGSYSDD